MFIGFALGMIAGFELAGPPVDFALGFIMFGVGIGFGHWIALRNGVDRAWRWVLTTSLGFGFGGAAALGLAVGVGDAVDAAFGGGSAGFAAVLSILGLKGSLIGSSLDIIQIAVISFDDEAPQWISKF
jgi:hypothetical protein